MKIKTTTSLYALLLTLAFSALACTQVAGPSSSGTTSTTSTGQGGSMARFAIANNTLYTVGDRSMTLINVTNALSPQVGKSLGIGALIETIFPFGNKLFIGAENGMTVYDISDEQDPKYITQVRHLRSRDPVVTDGKFAYVTLRDRSVVEVLDVHNLDSVTILRDYYINQPQGLALDSGVLFIATGSGGLYQQKIDSDGLLSEDPFVVSHYDAYDLIPRHGLLISTGALGITQFDYRDLSLVKELSTIAVKP